MKLSRTLNAMGVNERVACCMKKMVKLFSLIVTYTNQLQVKKAHYETQVCVRTVHLTLPATMNYLHGTQSSELLIAANLHGY